MYWQNMFNVEPAVFLRAYRRDVRRAAKFNKSQFVYRGVAGDRPYGEMMMMVVMMTMLMMIIIMMMTGLYFYSTIGANSAPVYLRVPGLFLCWPGWRDHGTGLCLSYC